MMRAIRLQISFMVLLQLGMGLCAQGPSEAKSLDAPGRWRKASSPTDDLSTKDKAEFERLQNIGYLSGVQAGPERRGVTTYEEEQASKGLNFFCSGHGPEAVLMDMEGVILHTWKKSFREIWPNYKLGKLNPNQYFYRRCHLYPNGDVLVIFEALGIARLDKNSNIIWALDNHAHHAVEVRPNGDIWLLTNKIHKNPSFDKDVMIREDFVTLLDSAGNAKKDISLLAAFQKSDFESVWNDKTRFSEMPKETEKPRFVGDPFHTNSIQILDGRIANLNSAFAEGNILTSMCALNAIAVLDVAQEKIIWTHKGGFALQHDAKILENGRLMLFDNMGLKTQSRVLEYDPKDMKVLWEYPGKDHDPFLTETCGTAQRLPNGNTLITESDNGRAFEINLEGEIVWEYVNEFEAAEHPEYIGVILEMQRLPPDYAQFLPVQK